MRGAAAATTRLARQAAAVVAPPSTLAFASATTTAAVGGNPDAAPAPAARAPPPTMPPPPSSASAASARGLRRSRALLEQRAPPESFNIRGVTFDGRQELIARLSPGEPCCLSKEPWNRFDAAAVAIASLRGEHLGYVDRRCTGAFSRERTYGFVDSVGRVMVPPPPPAAGAPKAEGGAAEGASAAAASLAPAPVPGPWGARVVVWPFLAAPLPEVLPDAMSDEADRRLGLRFPWEGDGSGEAAAAAAAEAPPPPPPQPPPARWRRLAAAALERARGVCEATGASATASQPLVVLPEWRWDEAQRAVVLANATAVCPAVARCVRAARLPPARSADRAAALGLTMDLMRWDVRSMQEYLEWQERRGEAAAREGWRLDLGGQKEEEGGDR